jgi:hypothetical protein
MLMKGMSRSRISINFCWFVLQVLLQLLHMIKGDPRVLLAIMT